MLARQFQGFETAPRLYRAITVRRQQIVEELHIELVVLDDQDRLRRQAEGLSRAVRRWFRFPDRSWQPPTLPFRQFVHRFSAKPLAYFAAKSRNQQLTAAVQFRMPACHGRRPTGWIGTTRNGCATGADLPRFRSATAVAFPVADRNWVEDLRSEAKTAELQIATLEYMLSDESLLLTFCQEVGIEPMTIAPAHALLSGYQI